MKNQFKEVVINSCYGGFGLSDEAYEELAKLGVPVKKYTQQVRGGDGKFLPDPENQGEIIFDNELTPPGEGEFDSYHKYKGKSKMASRYWDTWTRESREHPLLIKAIKNLGSKRASGYCSELEIVEIPADIEYTIEEYDGNEHIAEIHQTWS